MLSSTLLFGTGIGSACYLLLATLSRDARSVATVSRYVVITDWLFTATTAVAQPLTGFWMLHLAGIPWSTPGVLWSLWLYALALACWLPVVWIQFRCATWRRFGWWVGLGCVAFFAFLAIFYLMVAKRVPFVS